MIEIANILKDIPSDTKLFSPICGNVTFKKINSSHIICQTDNFCLVTFDKYGKWCSAGCWGNNGECLLFPSKNMQDWEKFSWKKGDVLIRGADFCIFNKWEQSTTQDDYVIFSCNYYKHHLRGFDKYVTLLRTNEWTLADNYDKEVFIAELKKYYGKKLNLNTSSIEIPTQPTILKPFQKVLVRNVNLMCWHINFFEGYVPASPYKYICLDGVYEQCIPYEGNEHLLNTCNKPNN